jgi:integrase
MATPKQTKEGTWQIRIRKRGYEDVSGTFKTKAQANTFQTNTLASMTSGQHVDVPKQARTQTVADLFLKRIAELPDDEASEQQRIKLTALLKYSKFMDRRLDQINKEDFRAWREARLKVVKPGTVKREMGTISGLFNHAINEWRSPIAKNPITGLAKPDGGDVIRTRGWEDWEVEALMKAANVNLDVKPVKKKDYCGWAVAVAVLTAMRKGEMLKAVAGDYHPKEQRLFLPNTKNDHTRNVSLSKKAIIMLDVLTQGLKPTDRIFPLSSSHLNNTFVAAKKIAGLTDPALIIHGGRHEATTRAVSKMSNMFELMAFTGHLDPKSAKRYYHPKAGQIADKLDED